MMITIAAAMFAAAAADTAANAQRSAFSTCLKQAIVSGKSAKVEVSAFDAYVRTQCAEPEAALRKAVIGIDLKNGISRADADENAKIELDDYFVGTIERYTAEMGGEPEQQQAAVQQ